MPNGNCSPRPSGAQAGRPPGRPRPPRAGQRHGLLATGRLWLAAAGHDLPPWPGVDHSFRSWRQQGRWEQIHRVLPVQERTRQGRRPTPIAAIWDRQSVKTPTGGPQGNDGAKQVNGRTRQLGRPLGLVGKLQGDCGRCQRPRRRHGVGGAAGPATGSPAAAWRGRQRRPRSCSWTGRGSAAASRSRSGDAAPLGQSGAGSPPGATPPIVSPFAVVPCRWVVDRTVAWLGRFRRLSQDDGYLTATSVAAIYLAMTGCCSVALPADEPVESRRVV
jgi:putative transposase